MNGSFWTSTSSKSRSLTKLVPSDFYFISKLRIGVILIEIFSSNFSPFSNNFFLRILALNWHFWMKKSSFQNWNFCDFDRFFFSNFLSFFERSFFFEIWCEIGIFEWKKFILNSKPCYNQVEPHLNIILFQVEIKNSTRISYWVFLFKPEWLKWQNLVQMVWDC